MESNLLKLRTDTLEWSLKCNLFQLITFGLINSLLRAFIFAESELNFKMANFKTTDKPSSDILNKLTVFINLFTTKSNNIN